MPHCTSRLFTQICDGIIEGMMDAVTDLITDTPGIVGRYKQSLLFNLRFVLECGLGASADLVLAGRGDYREK